ncbi:MAG TPA: hypothetical protein VND44_00720 [Acidimicrobiales bacterium]|nr:hypothetical protein [Acidimicrobiales bacterium]
MAKLIEFAQKPVHARVSCLCFPTTDMGITDGPECSPELFDRLVVRTPTLTRRTRELTCPMGRLDQIAQLCSGERGLAEVVVGGDEPAPANRSRLGIDSNQLDRIQLTRKRVVGAALVSPVDHIVPTSDGKGYWPAAAGGGPFAFDGPYLGAG